MKSVYICESEAQTEALGARLAETLKKGDVLALSGQLGAGKTALTRGIARALGCSGTVTSPTFAIMNYYEGKIPLAHFDVYRIQPEELYNTGFYDFVGGDCVSVIEWSDLISGLIDVPVTDIHIEVMQDNKRRITVSNSEE